MLTSTKPGIGRKILLVLSIAAALPAVTLAADPEPLKLSQTIAWSGPAGRLDHFGIDAQGERLFVANQGNNSLDVIDIKTTKILKQIPDQRKIHCIAYAPELDRIFAGIGEPGACNIFDARTYELLKSVPAPNANVVQFDSRTNLVFVGSASMTAIDAKTMAVKAVIELPALSRAFRIDPAHPRLYANTSDGSVCVIDTEKLALIAKYPVGAKGNAALALDSSSRRVFIGCRKEETKLVVLDTDSGKSIATLDIPGDVDDMWFDAKRKRIYASCGEGFLAVIQQEDGDRYVLASKLPTVRQARTSIWDSGRGRLYLGVPRQEGKDGPEIRVYDSP